MRPTTLARGIALCALALAGATTAALIAAPKAAAYTTADLSNLGFSVLTDNKGGGCIAWSAGLPGYNRTLIGQDCWVTFQQLLDNYINQNLPALQAYQAAHATTTAAGAVTVTVTQTIYDSAGGTFTVTVTNPGLTVTAPAQTVTAPPETTTETHTTYLPVPGPTITLPLIIDRYPTVTQTVENPAPPPETVTETQAETRTETRMVTTTRTVTVKAPAPKPSKETLIRRRRASYRTG